MEVTRDNFEEVFPEIEDAVKNASFIAIDAEFTGLRVGTSDTFSLFDSMNDRYQKLKTRASSFTLSQIGISTFTRNETKNSYKVKTFVFYIRPYLCGDIDRCFMCQASCLDFLCRYDFDFNKVFKEGIPFINEVEEKYLYEGLKNGNINFPHNFLSREDDMLINEELMKPSKNPDEKQRVLLEKDKLYPAYFQLIQIRNKYPSLCAYVDGDKIIVEKLSTEVKEQDLTEEIEKVMNFSLGFTKVFRLLKDAKKPIIGHNCLMDLLLCFHNFHQPLPEKYEEFKRTVHSVFPRIYDTRQIWRNVRKTCNLKQKVPKLCGLFELYEMLKKPPSSISTLFSPNIEFCNGRKYADGQFPHESGYDSYITGWVFINICHVIAMMKVKDPVFIEPQTFRQHLNAVSPFINKINLARSQYDFINFGGDDPQPFVPALLHVSKKSNSLITLAELSNVLGKYGNVDLKLMRSKRQAVVAVGSLGVFRDILTEFKNHEEWTITEFNFIQHAPFVKNILWSVAIGSAIFVAFLIRKMSTAT